MRAVARIGCSAEAVSGSSRKGSCDVDKLRPHLLPVSTDAPPARVCVSGNPVIPTSPAVIEFSPEVSSGVRCGCGTGLARPHRLGVTVSGLKPGTEGDVIGREQWNAIHALRAMAERFGHRPRVRPGSKGRVGLCATGQLAPLPARTACSTPIERARSAHASSAREPDPVTRREARGARSLIEALRSAEGPSPSPHVRCGGRR